NIGCWVFIGRQEKTISRSCCRAPTRAPSTSRRTLSRPQASGLKNSKMARTGSDAVSDLNRLRKFLDDEYRTAYLDSHVKGSIAYQIQEIREKLGLTQTEFGELVGMPQAVISRLESAEGGSVNMNTLLKIANGLKIGLAVKFCDFGSILDEDVSPA